MSLMSDLLRAISYSFIRVQQRGVDLLNEADPQTTFQLLEDWETTLDLPGECGDPPTSAEGRRAAIVSRLRGFGDPNSQAFLDLASALDYPTSRLVKCTPFLVGVSKAGDQLCGVDWRHQTMLIVPPSKLDAVLQCRVDEVAQLHGKVLVMNWEVMGLFTAEDLLAVASDDAGDWVAGGTNAEILLSTDGGTLWSSQTPDAAFVGDIHGVAHDGSSTWVFVGASATVQTSPDGVTWTDRAFSGTVSGGAIARDVVFGGGVFISAIEDGADGEIETSPDGISWTNRHTAAGDPLHAVTYGNGLYVAVGENGTILTSPNFTTWTARTPAAGYTGTFREVAYNGAVYIAVGDTDGGGIPEVQTSVNGITWTVRTPLTGGTPRGLEVSSDGLILFTDDAGKIQESIDDGVTWTDESHPFDTTGNGLFAVYASSTNWVVVGEAGTIYNS